MMDVLGDVGGVQSILIFVGAALMGMISEKLMQAEIMS
jgi:hypothetical protein